MEKTLFAAAEDGCNKTHCTTWERLENLHYCSSTTQEHPLKHQMMMIEWRFSYRIAGIFRGVKFSWIWKMLWVCGNNFVVTCTHALMGVAHCIYGNCLVGKYCVVCFSTTKTTKILPPPPPRKIPAIRYIILEALLSNVL